jgi:hypothetical protein
MLKVEEVNGKPHPAAKREHFVSGQAEGKVLINILLAL